MSNKNNLNNKPDNKLVKPDNKLVKPDIALSTLTSEDIEKYSIDDLISVLNTIKSIWLKPWMSLNVEELSSICRLYEDCNKPSLYRELILKAEFFTGNKYNEDVYKECPLNSIDKGNFCPARDSVALINFKKYEKTNLNNIKNANLLNEIILDLFEVKKNINLTAMDAVYFRDIYLKIDYDIEKFEIFGITGGEEKIIRFVLKGQSFFENGEIVLKVENSLFKHFVFNTWYDWDEIYKLSQKLLKEIGLDT